MCTMDDHHQEVIAYCREYGFHGLLGDDAEYAAFDPPRYFSSEHIKLTYKASYALHNSINFPTFSDMMNFFFTIFRD